MSDKFPWASNEIVIGDLADANNAYEALINANVWLRRLGEVRKALHLLDIARNLIHDDANKFTRVAIEYDNLKKTDDAEAMFKKALTVDPEDEETSKNYGVFLISHDRFAEGLKYLCNYIRAGNWSDYEILRLILDKGTADDCPEANEVLLSAWEHTLNHKIGYLYSQSAYKSEKYNNAIQVLELISKQTERDEYLNLLGLSLYRLKRNEEAIKALLRAIASVDKLFETQNFESETEEALEDEYAEKNALLGIYHANLAYLLNKEHHFDEALLNAEKSIEINESITALGAKAEALIGLSRFDEARNFANEVITSNDENDRNLKFFYRTILDSDRNLDDIDRYQLDIAEALTKYPDAVDFYKGAVNFLVRHNNYSEAEEILSKIEQTSIPIGQKGYFTFFRYTLLHRLGKPEEAWNILQPYAENFEWFNDFYPGENNLTDQDQSRNLAIQLLDTLWIDFEERIEDHTLIHNMLAQLVEHFPDDPEFYAYDISRALTDCELTLAETRLRTALELKDARFKPLFLNNYGYLLLVTGKIEEARTLLEQNVNGFQIQVEEFVRDYSWLSQYFIAVCRNGKIESDPKSYRYNDVPIEIALKINRCAVYLMVGEIERATSLVLSLLSDPLPEIKPTGLAYLPADREYVGKLVLGTLELAKGRYGEARNAWKRALAIVSRNLGDPDGPRLTLQKWIDEINK